MESAPPDRSQSVTWAGGKSELTWSMIRPRAARSRSTWSYSLPRTRTRHAESCQAARNLIADEELAAVKAPALVIWSSNDSSGPAKVGMDMAEKMPQGRFALVEDAGHWPQWEQADTPRRRRRRLSQGGRYSGRGSVRSQVGWEDARGGSMLVPCPSARVPGSGRRTPPRVRGGTAHGSTV